MAKKTLAEKVFYKIWDIKHQWYLSGSRDKSTWATLNGVQAKIRYMCQTDRYSYSPNRGTPEDFEIQMFHMVLFDRMSGREAYDAKEKKAQAVKLKQQQIEELKNHIKVIIPNVDLWRIREMLKNKIFSETVSRNLTVIFDKITDLEWPVK